MTYLLFYPCGLREGKKTGQESSFWPCESRLGVMIEPALEGAGQPARRRGMASERRVAATGPASGGVWGEPLPGGAMEATGGSVASAGPSQCKYSVDVRGRA